MSPEEWRPVPGYEGAYDVSSMGRIRSWKPYRGQALPRLRQPYQSDTGYYVVSLQGGGKPAVKKIHRLVTEAFIGPQPLGMMTRHLNGDALDNRLENLVYGTGSENGHDTVAHGRNQCSNRTHCPEGHEYSADNTRVVRVRGEFRHRACRTCERRRDAERRARKREAA